jgi:transcriptional regulator
VYTPEHFAIDEPEQQLDLIERIGFGLLITALNGRITNTAIPFLLDRSGPSLYGHVARANPHWAELERASDLHVVFTGPHAYISPSWYQRRDLVPTWNYVTVQVTGRAHLLDDQQQRLDLVDRLSAHFERELPQPWHSSSLEPTLRDKLLHAIVAFRIDIDSIAGKAKLGQNRDAADTRSAAAQLVANDTPPIARQLALLMLEQMPRG